tara:strand:+ start:262 stop:654 length:393 start_codon:yes stop_codon:yes gene_type:complete
MKTKPKLNRVSGKPGPRQLPKLDRVSGKPGPRKLSNRSKPNGTTTTTPTPIEQKKSDFDKWRDKHADSLKKIAKGSEVVTAAIQEGGFTRGLGVGTGDGGPITKGAPASVGGDEFQGYQKESDKLKNRKN